MQTRNIVTDISDLLSRLIPSGVSIREEYGGAAVLFIALRVVGDLDGQRWRRLQAKCPLWRERISSVKAEFLDAAAHQARTWQVSGTLMADEGFVPESTSPVRRVFLALALVKTDGATAEELPPVSAITFNIAKADGTVVHKATTRRAVAVNVPSMERGGC